MKKTLKKGHPSTKVRIWLIALGVACLGLLVWFVVNDILIAQDRSRFAEAEQKKNLIFTQLINSFGKADVTTVENQCYSAEQGPFDNGRLWCQVASVAYYAQNKSSSESAIGESMRQLIDANNWQTASTIDNEVKFEGAQGLVCGLEFESGRVAHEGAARLSPGAEAEFAIIIRCADRARSAYYPYSVK